MTVDYTKMLVGPLRSKLDVGRNLVNKSRTDLINSLQAFELKESMEKLTEKLDKFKKKIDQ
jgi:predicted translin family RNA/ssDNA-binding protein